MRITEPITIVRPIQPVIVKYEQIPEVKPSAPLQGSNPRVEPAKPEAKELTPDGKAEPKKINEKLTNPPQNVNFSPTRPLKKLPQKMKFKGKPGRQRTEAQVEELLTYVQTRGSWPNGISDQMQRYYRREYPEYFRKGKTGKKKVHAKRSEPINISARRSGTNA